MAIYICDTCGNEFKEGVDMEVDICEPCCNYVLQENEPNEAEIAWGCGKKEEPGEIKMISMELSENERKMMEIPKETMEAFKNHWRESMIKAGVF